jgi:type IV fimbrial biogenesis protein FimT
MAQAVEQGRFGASRAPCTIAAGTRRGPLGMARGSSPCAAAGGWTLVELMIALALAAIMVTLAVPGYHDWIATYQLASHAEHLANSLALARSEAIKRGHRVNLCPAPGGVRCADGANWDAGWLVYVDANRDGRNADDEPVLRAEAAAPAGIQVRANRPVADYVSFTGLGQARLLAGGLQMGTFTLCRRGLAARKVVLANSGRVRMETSRDACTD